MPAPKRWERTTSKGLTWVFLAISRSAVGP